MTTPALALIDHQARKAWAWLATNTEDVTQEQANWRPGGSANSIAATYAHAVVAADVDLSRHFYEREPLIAGEWGRGLGLDETFPDHWHRIDLNWDDLRAYGEAVAARVIEMIEHLAPRDLERSFQLRAFAPKVEGQTPRLTTVGTWKGFDIFTLHGHEHIWMHGGEIACLKGIQGGTGYRPFTSLWSY